MNPEGRQRHVSDVTLEQYLLEELSRSEMAATKRLLEEDESLQTRLEELKRSNRAILERYPVALMSERIRAGLDDRPAPRYFGGPFPMKAFFGAAAATLLLLVLFLPHEFDSSRPGETSPTERIKGRDSQLRLYRKTRDGSEVLDDGARVDPGDVIRIGYLAGDRPYGIILSVDGRGTVTLHVPHRGSRSVRLKNDGPVLLDFALEIDDAPHWERFYFVTGVTPFEVSPVLQAAEQIDTETAVDRAERLVLPEGLDQFVVSLDKGMER